MKRSVSALLEQGFISEEEAAKNLPGRDGNGIKRAMACLFKQKWLQRHIEYFLPTILRYSEDRITLVRL